MSAPVSGVGDAGGSGERVLGFAAAPEAAEEAVESSPIPTGVDKDQSRAKKAVAEGPPEEKQRHSRDALSASEKEVMQSRFLEEAQVAPAMQRRHDEGRRLELKLLETIRTGSSEARCKAVRELGRGAGERAVEALIWALQQDDLELRLSAVVALGEIGPAAKAALPALRRLLERESEVAVSATREQMEQEIRRADIRRATREAITKIER